MGGEAGVPISAAVTQYLAARHLSTVAGDHLSPAGIRRRLTRPASRYALTVIAFDLCLFHCDISTLLNIAILDVTSICVCNACDIDSWDSLTYNILYRGNLMAHILSLYGSMVCAANLPSVVTWCMVMANEHKWRDML